jgi:hypothetical protein
MSFNSIHIYIFAFILLSFLLLFIDDVHIYVDHWHWLRPPFFTTKEFLDHADQVFARIFWIVIWTTHTHTRQILKRSKVILCCCWLIISDVVIILSSWRQILILISLILEVNKTQTPTYLVRLPQQGCLFTANVFSIFLTHQLPLTYLLTFSSWVIAWNHTKWH